MPTDDPKKKQCSPNWANINKGTCISKFALQKSTIKEQWNIQFNSVSELILGHHPGFLNIHKNRHPILLLIFQTHSFLYMQHSEENITQFNSFYNQKSYYSWLLLFFFLNFYNVNVTMLLYENCINCTKYTIICFFVHHLYVFTYTYKCTITAFVFQDVLLSSKYLDV